MSNKGEFPLQFEYLIDSSGDIPSIDVECLDHTVKEIMISNHDFLIEKIFFIEEPISLRDLLNLKLTQL